MFINQIAVALFLTGITAWAQEIPWQVSIQTPVSFDAGSSKIFIDLPQPPTGRILTVEQVTVMIGPLWNPYAKVHQCEVQSARPNLAAENVEPMTRVLLPFPEWLSPASSRTRAIVASPVRIHVESGSATLRSPVFRLSCDSEFVTNDRMTVSLVGYTRPKP
ncbi:MAG: hypothetical protein FJW32_09330 [Acidobacteria bacterium]|nr:hypothetical protein [Acidobacteriota bacterium]